MKSPSHIYQLIKSVQSAPNVSIRKQVRVVKYLSGKLLTESTNETQNTNMLIASVESAVALDLPLWAGPREMLSLNGFVRAVIIDNATVCVPHRGTR